jgi:hypothetical protein
MNQQLKKSKVRALWRSEWEPEILQCVQGNNIFRLAKYGVSRAGPGYDRWQCPRLTDVQAARCAAVLQQIGRGAGFLMALVLSGPTGQTCQDWSCTQCRWRM